MWGVGGRGVGEGGVIAGVLRGRGGGREVMGKRGGGGGGYIFHSSLPFPPTPLPLSSLPSLPPLSSVRVLTKDTRKQKVGKKDTEEGEKKDRIKIWLRKIKKGKKKMKRRTLGLQKKDIK